MDLKLGSRSEPEEPRDNENKYQGTHSKHDLKAVSRRRGLFVAWDQISSIALDCAAEYLEERGIICGYSIVDERQLRCSNREALALVIRDWRLLVEVGKLLAASVRTSINIMNRTEDGRVILANVRLLGIQIGDIILGCSLRKHSRSRLMRVKELLWCTRETVLVTLGCSKLDLSTVKLLGVWEDSYMMKALCRIAVEKQHIDYLRVNRSPDVFRIYRYKPGIESYESLLKCDGESIRRVRKENLREAESFVNSRLADISKISYMDKIREKAEEDFFVEITRQTPKEAEERLCNWKTRHRKVGIVYAHSFSDAQLSKGWDGFDGSYDWLIKSIRFCRDSGIGVAIKPHPAWQTVTEADVHETFRVDRDYLGDLYQGSSLDEECVTLPLSWRPTDVIKNLEGLQQIHISHHGTVIPELAYLGQECLFSNVSDWGCLEVLGESYGAPEELRTCIDLFSKRVGSRSPCKEDVLRFIYAYCLESCSVFVRDRSFGFEKCFFDVLRRMSPKEWQIGDNELRRRAGDTELKNIVMTNQKSLRSAFKEELVRAFR